MRAAYVSDQQFPIDKADAEQVINTVSALGSEGMDIRLVIPRDWRTFGVPKRRRVERLKTFYHVTNDLSVSELISFPLSRSRAEKYTHGVLAPIWAKLAGCTVVYTRNLVPAYLATRLGLSVIFETYRVYRPSAAAGAWLGRWSRSSRLLGIITHSEVSSDSLLRCGVREEKVRAIHNGFNPALFDADLSKQEARGRLRVPTEAKIACYAGRMDRRKGIESLLELADRTPEITYWLIGKSQKDREGWVTRDVADRGLRNVNRIPWMTEDRLVEYLWAADALLIPTTAEPLEKYGKTVLPMKLFKYLAAGRPILAPALPDTVSVLNDENAALVQPDDVGAAVEAIRRIMTDTGWATAIVLQARSDAEGLTWRARARRIIAFIDERLSDHPGGSSSRPDDCAGDGPDDRPPGCAS
jgi:glycosyltransferase involved in cell wall biosynthesis